MFKTFLMETYLRYKFNPIMFFSFILSRIFKNFPVKPELVRFTKDVARARILAGNDTVKLYELVKEKYPNIDNMGDEIAKATILSRFI